MKYRGQAVAQTSVVPIRWMRPTYRLPTLTAEEDKPGALGVQVLIFPPYESPGATPVQAVFYGRRCTEEPDFYIWGRPIPRVEWWAEMPKPAAGDCRICAGCGQEIRRLNSESKYCNRACRQRAALARARERKTKKEKAL